MTLGLFLLPAERRGDFAWPRGLVYSGDFTRLVRGYQPVFCIGDVVSSYCARVDLPHVVLVVDGKTRRSIATETLNVEGYEKVRVVNPRGTLSHQVFELYCTLARSRGKWIVEVDGEEDMTALAALACSPPGGVVVYGVPGVGAAIIPVSRLVSREAQSRILSLKPSLIVE